MEARLGQLLLYRFFMMDAILFLLSPSSASATFLLLNVISVSGEGPVSFSVSNTTQDNVDAPQPPSSHLKQLHEARNQQLAALPPPQPSRGML